MAAGLRVGKPETECEELSISENISCQFQGALAIQPRGQTIRLSHIADLAVLVFELVARPPPFVVVGSPVQLSLRIDITKKFTHMNII